LLTIGVIFGTTRRLEGLPVGLSPFVLEAVKRPGKSGVLVLDQGEEALLARAWLVDHATTSIEVQYFIWSSDNIGTLASEALLRAADRGVSVRVIVDDLLIDAPDKVLLALSRHPRIQIRIYNPNSSVGVPFHRRLWNLITNFHDFNQRMHNKVFIVDGILGITGGRNMAGEYFDYNHTYNFRDRDVLLMGRAVKEMRESFESFWQDERSVPVAKLYDGYGIFKKNIDVNDEQIREVYRELHLYAENPENFEPEVRDAINAIPSYFQELKKTVRWCDVDFASDRPGKNSSSFGLHGGGELTSTLASLLKNAKDHVVIQTPYLILSDRAFRLFQETLERGVSIRIHTNSLSSTDNLASFSGYRNQRNKLLKIGIEIYEYKSYPENQKKLMTRYSRLEEKHPIFSLHAKTMVIDSKFVVIGTYNLDPRSENLNTEVGAIIQDPVLARQVEGFINEDMRPENSWNAAIDDPDQYVPFLKRLKLCFYRLLPIKPLL